MKSINEIINIGQKAAKIEADAISNLVSYIDSEFAKAVREIFLCKGRLIVAGIGKSANIAAKIVATLNSTGTPAIFMHAADAIHGDLGIILEDDIVLCLSKSGNTPEIKVLVPFIKKFGNKIIALVSNTDSFLAKNADFIVKAPIEKEACPNNLAPTTSTTAQLVMGDALAVALLECRGFSSNDFAKYHPGGALGKQLYLKVKDLIVNNEKPLVSLYDNMQDVILEISSKCLGVTAVLNENNHLAGVITDGDLRRMLEKNKDISGLQAKDVMTSSPKTIESSVLAIYAFNLMKKNNITQLLVVDNDNYIGVVHIHDILREGIV